MTPRVGVERRNPHQAMHADLRLQQAVRVFAVDFERGRFDARALALQPVRHHGLHVVPLRPAQIHAQQHLRPVLAFGSARARMDGHDRALGVVGTVEQHPGFQNFQTLGKALDLAVQVGRYVFAFASQLEQRIQIRSQARHLGLIAQSPAPGACAPA